MNISQAGLELIISFEGKLKLLPDGRYKAYRCPAGVWTVFAGCTHGVHEGMIVTEAEGEAMFRREIATFEAAVMRLVTQEMTQHQFDALVSFAYNCGARALEISSILKKFNAGDIDGAAKAFAPWNKATVKGKKTVLRGLVRRRAAEAALFLTPDPPPEAEPEPEMPQEIEQPGMTNGQKTMVASAGVGAGGLGTTLIADPAGSLQTVVSIKSSLGLLLAGLPIGRLMIPVLIVGVGAAAAVYVWRRANG